MRCVSLSVKHRGVAVMTVQFSRQGMVAIPVANSVAASSLVRRLLQSHDNPAKWRMLAWLMGIDDQRLLRYGLTLEDIAVLRQIPRP